MRISKVVVVLLILLVLAAVGWLTWQLRDLPSVDTIPERLTSPSLRIVDRNGSLLYEALPQ